MWAIKPAEELGNGSSRTSPLFTAQCLTLTSQPSTTIQWQLVLPLFRQKAALVMGGVTMPLMACVAWLDCRQPWLLVWAAATLLVLAGRLGLARAFECRARPETAWQWSRRFAAGAWALGALWGCSAFVVVAGADPMAQMLLIATTFVCVMGGAARNAGYLPAARGQILLGIAPGLITCASTGKPMYLVLAFLMGMGIIASFTIMTNVNEKTVQALTLNEENAKLVSRLLLATNQLETINGQLETVAMTDALTGIANRRYFDRALEAEVARAQCDSTSLSLLLLDIDFFKSFNDLYGHLAGDDCLRLIAQTFAAMQRRPSDVVARYGGEEFVAILPHTDARDAATVAERVRASVEALGVVHTAGLGGITTVSIGVASYQTGRHAKALDLVRAADDALYGAKGAGRNCVRLATAASSFKLEGSRQSIPSRYCREGR